MVVPLGEGSFEHIDLNSLLEAPEPTFKLLEPQVAPVDMLEAVRVNTPAQRLETDTPLGTLAVEMYWNGEDGGTVGSGNRADFFSALGSDTDPEAASNPLTTQNYPFTILPDGVLYQVVVRVPREAVDVPWSAETKRRIGGGTDKLGFGGMGLGEFRRMYPWVEVDIPEGMYDITTTERTRPALGLLARAENGEPLARTQKIRGNSVRYNETVVGGFVPSALHPETAIATIDSRLTLRDSGEADRQRLEFKIHDGFQRAGEGAAEHSGLLELIVMGGEEVEVSEFTFTPSKAPVLLRPAPDSHYRGTASRDATFGFDEKVRGLGDGSLSGGETRYRAPEKIAVNMGGMRVQRVIAAFRFAMAGAD